uniref:Uncharacterized protein n=1 Tax=Rhizophora mucronata TaxID=61149 RepID=A0A2P2PMQ0_RHIMU
MVSFPPLLRWSFKLSVDSSLLSDAFKPSWFNLADLLYFVGFLDLFEFVCLLGS